MILNVEAFIFKWLGMVKGVLLPSEFSRIMEMCSFSRTIRKPSISNALITFRFGASTGNFVIRLRLRFQR